ncbi:MAG: hypothetical protein RL670_1285 [Actinomycetota bacterium]
MLVSLALVAIWLAVIDARSQRIPNRIVLPALAAGLLLIGFFDFALLGQAALAAAASFGLFLVLNLVSRGQLGMGDVKLAALLGLGLGALGWGYWLLGVALGFVFGAFGALVLLIGSRGSNRKSFFAYGPYLVAGALASGILGFAL